MWNYVNNNRRRSTSFSYVYYHKVQYLVLECERDVKLTCLINPSQCLTQKCQKLGQCSNSWTLTSSVTQGIPPTFDGYIPNICFFQWYGILVFIAERLVLLSHLWLFMFLCVFVHQLTLMKIIGFLSIYHMFMWIIKAIHNLYHVPILLGAHHLPWNLDYEHLLWQLPCSFSTT